MSCQRCFQVLALALALAGAACTDKATAEDSGAGAAGPVDRDGDGYDATEDCDDGNSGYHPGVEEVCDEIDQDCDGLVDDDASDASSWRRDADGDTYGDDAQTIRSCEQPEGYCARGGDCDDSDAEVHPRGTERCDGVDQDCDGVIDEGGPWFVDRDGDGYGDTTTAMDACTADSDNTSQGGDCDDTRAEVHPEVEEVCNGLDDDCDGETDEGGPWYLDLDGDGYGDDATETETCEGAGSYITLGGDCDDGDANLKPGAVETCDEIDNDCDGVVDDGGPWYADRDGDGYGANDEEVTTCPDDPVYILTPGDCDDTDIAISPDAADLCDGVDNDCDHVVDDHLTCTTCDESETAFDLIVPDDVGSIQGAIDLASSGDRVCVREGTWYESLDFGGKDILVYGEGGAGATIIDASGLGGAVVQFVNGETSDATLQGFTLTGGEGIVEAYEATGGYDYLSATFPTYVTLWCGGGVYANGASPTLVDLIITDIELPPYQYSSGSDDVGIAYYLEVSLGGGLCFRDSSSELVNVDVARNFAFEGGAMYLDEASTITWTQGEVYGNSGSDGGVVYVDHGTLTLRNVISTSNTADLGALLYAMGGDVTLMNVTSYGDDSGSGYGAVLYGYYGDVTLSSTIIADWSAGTGVHVYEYDHVTELTYNLIHSDGLPPWDVWSGGLVEPDGVDGNISVDPEFRGGYGLGPAIPDDLRLDVGSPAIDAGDPDAVHDDVDGTRNDMGAYGGPDGAWGASE